MHFWQEMICVSYAEYMMKLSLITGDVEHDHLVKMVSSGFIHWKFTIFF